MLATDHSLKTRRRETLSKSSHPVRDSRHKSEFSLAGAVFYKKDPIYYVRSYGYPCPRPGGEASRVGSDNRVNSLCNRLLASSSDEEVAALASELKVALHEHIESLRTQLKGSLQRHPSDEYGSRYLQRSD